MPTRLQNFPLTLRALCGAILVLAASSVASWGAQSPQCAAFLYQSGTFLPLCYANVPDLSPLDINNRGQIVAWNGTDGFLLDGPNITTIDYPGASQTALFGINDSNQVVGIATLPGGFQGFLYRNSAFASILVPGSQFTAPRSIDTYGNIVGYYSENSLLHGFEDHEGRFTTIDYPGARLTVATGVNDLGEIVGMYLNPGANDWQGFLYSSGTFVAIDFPGAPYAIPWGLNNSGDVVGYYLASSGYASGFLFDGVNFESLAQPGVNSTYLTGINDSEQIVGYNNFVAAPTPEPATSLLLASGLLSAVLGIRRKLK